MLILNDMSSEFGQSDFNYPNEDTLVDAVSAFPGRFSPEAHDLVSRIVADRAQVTIP